jgi:CelD/BcsL family acetyltransferase involved in cellulose biosynthesis
MTEGRAMMLDLHDPRWLEFVRSCSNASPFHHPSWAKLLADCYGYRPFALTLTDAAGGIRAGVPVLEVRGPLGGRRWVALPFTDYCPLLTRDRTVGEVVPSLVEEVSSRKLDLLELRAGLPEHGQLHARTEAVRHTLALGADPDELYRRFSKMHQRNIRKAERAGVQVEHGQAASDVETFYSLHLLTRQRLGVPIQPRRYFHLLARDIVRRGLGFVLSARVDGVPAAAAVFLAWNGTLVYKYGASDPRLWEARPNNLLFWSAIRWGCENGYHTLDWGRTDLEDQGLRDFKSGWGANEEPLIYSVVADAPRRSTSAQLRKAMGAVIRRSPPWVCQAVGECLYRFAA